MYHEKKMLFFLIIISICVLWFYWSNHYIEVTNIQIYDELIPKEFDEFVLVHISDLHNAQFGDKQQVLLDKISNANPDIITITGDLIDCNHTNLNTAIEFIDGAVKLAPIYYVTGNHEAWSEEYSDLKKYLKKMNVLILEDEAVFLKQGEKTLRLIGLDDPDFMLPNDLFGEKKDMVNKKLQDIIAKDNSYYTILLSHRPELVEVYSNHSINLVLSGHAHGGQFRIPFIGGVIAPNQGFFPTYTEGKYNVNQTQMIVNRGLGNSIIPFRVNNRPEIVVIELNHLNK